MSAPAESDPPELLPPEKAFAPLAPLPDQKQVREAEVGLAVARSPEPAAPQPAPPSAPQTAPPSAPQAVLQPAPQPAPQSAPPLAPAPVPPPTGPGLSEPAGDATVAATPVDRATVAQAESPSGPSPLMDREFIERNGIVERYLAGRLPLKGVLDFERYCREHPAQLDEIGLGAKVHAALRLLEVGGQPLPWDRPAVRIWQRLPVPIVLALLVLALGGLSLGLRGALATRAAKIVSLQKQIATDPIEPIDSTQQIELMPDRTAPSSQSLATLNGDTAVLADLHIHMGWSHFGAFRVVIDRIDQGRVAVLHRMQRDSNGDLRIALNSSALGPGQYLMTIDGLTWRGDPVAQAWATFSVVR